MSDIFASIRNKWTNLFAFGALNIVLVITWFGIIDFVQERLAEGDWLGWLMLTAGVLLTIWVVLTVYRAAVEQTWASWTEGS